MATQPSTTSPSKRASLSSSAPGANQPPATMQTAREMNYAVLCRVGKEIVQEIVFKSSELFEMLKAIQLPSTDTATQQYNDRKTKLEEQTKAIRTKFRTLRLIYDKLNAYTVDKNMIDVDHMVLVSAETHREHPKHTNEEHKEIIKQIEAKNAQLKEIIDKQRLVVWEINTTIAAAMRK